MAVASKAMRKVEMECEENEEDNSSSDEKEMEQAKAPIQMLEESIPEKKVA